MLRRRMPETEVPKENKSDQAQSLQRYALSSLARREHCRAELRRKLRKRGGAEAATELLLDELEGAGHLSETRFVESMIRSRVRRGYGPVRIRRELRQRGAKEDCIEAGLQEANCNWQELAEQRRKRKFGDAAPAGFKEQMKCARHLESCGFDADTIRQILHPLSEKSAP